MSYASFPVNDTLTVEKDSIDSETVEQYHLRMQAMGFDISSCRCEDCQKSISFNNFNKYKENSNRSYLHTLSFLWMFLIVIMVTTLGLIIKSFTRWYNDGSLS